MRNQIQKTFNFLVTLLIFTSLISSCKKDDDNNSNPIPATGATIKTTIIGKVIDTDGLLVIGATVSIGSLTTTTDNHGNFFL
ncbi:MAG: hypothetical protein IPP71_01035 [Bacteroidetes bacterium]|nr:hypothetical protein [Bacteroidota bacterium]